MTLEEAVNKILKSLFLSNHDDNANNYLIGLDDDKLHINFWKGSAMNGLKTVHHVNDNVQGFTLHTADFSAACVPVCAMFQQEKESVQGTYLQILKFLFGQGREAAPDLKGMTLASDHGYWKPSFIFEHVFEAGTNIEGTVQKVSLIVICFIFLL